MIDWKDLVWAVVNLDNGSKVECAYEDVRAARRLAESIVGNRAASHPSPDIYLYGPGDTTVSVLVRQLPRQMILDDDVPIIPW